MLYPTINELLNYVDNRYMLVNVTARRARDIAERADVNGERLEEKPVKMAITEISEGHVRGSLYAGLESSARE